MLGLRDRDRCHLTIRHEYSSGDGQLKAEASTVNCISPTAGAPRDRFASPVAAAADPGAGRAGCEPVAGDAAAARHALCQAALLAGQPLRLRIRGASMVPALWPGEWVAVHSGDMKSVTIGEVVVFSRDGRFIAHRVVRIDAPGGSANKHAVVTRGDAADDDDSPVLHSEWLGVVAAVQRFGAPRTVRRKPSALARVAAPLVRRSDLARRSLDRWSMMLMCMGNPR